MKKVIYILLISLFALTAKAQFPKPTGAVTIPTYSMFRNPSDSSITIYQGSVNLYNTFVQHFDTIKLSGWVNNRKLLKYRLIGDTITKDGTATNYRLLHKIDSIMALVKYRNDTVVITGYATRGYVINNYEPKISKSVGFLKWNGSAWAWDTNIYSTDIHANAPYLNLVIGSNSGDETEASIKSKLGITTISGSNNGDNAPNSLYSSLKDSDLVRYTKTQADAKFVPKTRTITATAPITIDGTTSADLSANRTIAISAATPSTPGSMSAADKTKLDGIATGATANTGTVTSVTGGTGITGGTITTSGTLAIDTTVVAKKTTVASMYQVKGNYVSAYLPNDTWVYGYDYAGNLVPLYKLSKDNLFEFAPKVGLGSLYSVADAGKQWIVNMPLKTLADTVEYAIGFGGKKTFKFRALADGSGGYTDSRFIIDGKFQQPTGAVNGYFLKTDANGVGTWSAITGIGGYLGTYNATTNTPTLTNGDGARVAGDWYLCTTAGGAYSIGDQAYYNGAIWQRVPASYTLQTASASVLGGIKIGNGITMTGYVASVKTDYVENVTHTGDAEGSSSLTVKKINGAALSGLATGILKNTTSTGVPSIAVAGDFPTLNQNTTGTAAGLTAAYTDWNSTTGGSSILNKPTSFELPNDVWTRVYDYAGNLSNMWKLSKDNILTPAFTLGVNSLFFVRNSGINTIGNLVVDVDATTNDYHGYKMNIGGIQAFKLAGKWTGSGIDSIKLTVPIMEMTTGAAANKIAMSEDSRGKVRWSDTKYLFNLVANRILFASATNEMGQIASGSAGQLMQSNGASAPAWTTATYPSTAINNNVLLGNGTDWTSSNISGNWNTAYSDRMKWDGGSTGLTAATGRTSLGGSTIGQSIFTLTNPSATTFLRMNADNTATALSASDFRTAIGAGTSSAVGTVTSVAALTLGTTGTDLSSSVATGTTTPVITLNVPTASAANRGVLSAADWSTFNGKQSAGSYQPLATTLTNITDSLLARYTKTQANYTFAPISHTQAQTTITALPDSLLARYTKTQANYSFLAKVAPGSSGNVLTSNGSIWTSVAPAGSMTYPTNGYVGTSLGTSWSNTITTTSLMLSNQNNNTGSYTITSGNFILYSDRRLKTGIKSLSSNDLDKVAKIDFRKFYMKSDSTHLRYGVIAQEVQKSMPELVDTDANGMLSVKYIDLLIAKIAQLEKRIADLEYEVARKPQKAKTQIIIDDEK